MNSEKKIVGNVQAQAQLCASIAEDQAVLHSPYLMVFVLRQNVSSTKQVHVIKPIHVVIHVEEFLGKPTVFHVCKAVTNKRH